MLALIPKFMVETHRLGSGPVPRFDFAGAGLFAIGLSLLLYGLIEAAPHGWSSAAVVPSLVLGVVCAIAFVRVEKRVAAPMVNLSLFHDAGFSAGNLAKVFAYLSFSANGILLPFYLYRSLNMPPSEVGLALTLFPVGMLVSSLVVGPLSDRIGTRILAPVGVLGQFVAAIMLAVIQPEQGFCIAAAAMLLAGIGIGTFIAPNDSAILNVTPPDRIGVANGIMGVSRSIGLMLGQAVAAGILSAQLIVNNGAFLPSLHQTYIVIAILTTFGVVLAAVRGRIPAFGHVVH